MNRLPAILLLALAAREAPAADTFTPWTTVDEVARDVGSLWDGLDFRREPLDIEIVAEWKSDGIVCRYLRYTVCTVEGTPSKVAALYTFPEGGTDLPAFVWAHGGGQRAERARGRYFARRGYAVLDINWGGRELVEGIAVHTDWGKVDPSQGPRFYPGALRPHVKLNLEPDEHTIDPVPSPRNGNWFLLTCAARRALTLLERQPEVDPERLGIAGYSMGGNITVFAAIDPRVVAAVPMVGGTGSLTEDFPGLPGSAVAAHFPHPELFALTNDCAAYWPRIGCPVLVLGATNDFHGIFERAFAGVRRLPHDAWRASHRLHDNHALGPEQWILMNRWFDHHLAGTGEPLPPTPRATLAASDSRISTFTVRPGALDTLDSVQVLYSHDPDPRTRFWKTAPARRIDPGAWTAEVPRRPRLPLLVFAHCTYRLDREVDSLVGPTATFSLNSDVQTIDTERIDAAALRENASRHEVFHDFTTEGRDGWSAGSEQRGMRTYRFREPERAPPDPGTRLVLHFQDIDEPASLRLRIAKNEFLGNGKERRAFVCAHPVTPGLDVLEIACSEFREQGGEATMASWDDITHLTLEILGIEDGRHVHLAGDWVGKRLLRMTWKP